MLISSDYFEVHCVFLYYIFIKLISSHSKRISFTSTLIQTILVDGFNFQTSLFLFQGLEPSLMIVVKHLDKIEGGGGASSNILTMCVQALAPIKPLVIKDWLNMYI